MNLDIFKNAFNDIVLDEDTHKYTLNDGKYYISVTEILKKYEHPFEELEIAERTAKRRNVDKNDLIYEWRKKGENSRKKGTAIHRYIESKYHNQCNELTHEDEHYKLKQQVEQFFDYFMQDKIWIYSEKIIYHPDINIAGTIDCMVYCKKEDILYFIDWKTNDKLSFSNKYNNFKYPLDKYEASNLNSYSLQVSLYRYIIEEQILIKSQSMSEVKDKSKNLIVQFSDMNDSFCIYETPYHKYSIVQLLNHYNQTKGK